MISLFIYLFLALGVSAICSVLEAVLLSITPTYASSLEATSPRIGARLIRLKKDIDRPLAAILSLNTIAHTVGAAGVGAQSLSLFGSGYVAVTSAILTFLMLVTSEIIPKTVGVLYWRELSRPTALALPFLVFLLCPLVYLSERITRLLSRDKAGCVLSHDEVRAMADLGFREGLFGEQEARIFKNLLRLGDMRASEIMTPRTVMFALDSEMSAGEVIQDHPGVRFSRIPVYSKDPENIRSYVLHGDILREFSRHKTDTRLHEIARRIQVFPGNMSLLTLFERVVKTDEHIGLVVDEYGGVSGVLTLEDILETLLGIQIVDETDMAADMQALARKRWAERAATLGVESEKAAPDEVRSESDVPDPDSPEDSR